MSSHHTGRHLVQTIHGKPFAFLCNFLAIFWYGIWPRVVGWWTTCAVPVPVFHIEVRCPAYASSGVHHTVKILVMGELNRQLQPTNHTLQAAVTMVTVLRLAEVGVMWRLVPADARQHDREPTTNTWQGLKVNYQLIKSMCHLQINYKTSYIHLTGG